MSILVNLVPIFVDLLFSVTIIVLDDFHLQLLLKLRIRHSHQLPKSGKEIQTKKGRNFLIFSHVIRISDFYKAISQFLLIFKTFNFH